MKTRAMGAAPTEKQKSTVARGKKTRPKAKKRKLAGDDPARPKKPPTAFFYFLEDFRKTFQEENPDVKSMREIGKACGEKWKTMNFEEKVAYYDLATEKRAEFEKAMAEYIKRKESADSSDYSSGEY
ncbi:High mobility group B protein 14 [Apostasia shenzhenica]|uniref:High mobility group B protein 14 n=1 Tax=Apostasia shenzhenica TaxID=1088818 RepID=A0A2I0A3Q7_9ASPA|nr:High mobility group B protein 14 [Apostasia shenzhenica]